MKVGFKDNKCIAVAFWVTMVVFLGVCAYYMIHDAYWRIEDEAIVIAHTGMGKAFSPTGFDCMVDCYGRLYPFAYNLYNVLLLFHDGYISPTDHYILQSIALVVYALSFAAIALFLLKNQPIVCKYTTTFCFVAVCVARVYTEFITCYTGMWIVFMFLPVFLWSACKFEQTGKWVYGIISLLVINYISYCYETVFVIPLAMGGCSLLFNYKNLNKNRRLFDWFLVASGLLFLSLYVIIVLPRASHFYRIHHDISFLIKNAFKMFIAQKIYWIAIVVLVWRIVEIISKKSTYSFYDSMLLAAFAYFCGAAVLGLDFTYYYNVGSLTALVPILHFLIEKFKPHWGCVFMVCLAAFYCRKMPLMIKTFHKERTHAFSDVSNLSKYIGKEDVFWYAPEYEDATNLWADLRSTMRWRLEVYLSWLMHQDVHIKEREVFSTAEKGIWLFPSENKKLFPNDDTANKVQGAQVFSAHDIYGCRVQ